VKKKSQLKIPAMNGCWSGITEVNAGGFPLLMQSRKKAIRRAN
jgi:hypothetical protein